MTYRTIWMYWENVPGRVRPPYLDLCLETVHRHAGEAEVRVLDSDGVFAWLPDTSPGIWFRLPSPVSRADYARPRLVHRYGGLWLDFDTIAISSLSAILDELRRNDVVGWGSELDGRFYNNLFAGTPGSRFLEDWIEQQDGVLRRTADWRTLRWAALGQDITWPLARRSSYLNMPMGRIAPIPWWRWRQFLSRLSSPARLFVDRPITVMLWNKLMAADLMQVPKEEVLNGRMLLSRLLRIGLGRSVAEQEEDAWTRLHWISDLRFSTQGRRVEIHVRRLYGRLGSRKRQARGDAVHAGGG